MALFTGKLINSYAYLFPFPSTLDCEISHKITLREINSSYKFECLTKLIDCVYFIYFLVWACNISFCDCIITYVRVSVCFFVFVYEPSAGFFQLFSPYNLHIHFKLLSIGFRFMSHFVLDLFSFYKKNHGKYISISIFINSHTVSKIGRSQQNGVSFFLIFIRYQIFGF